VVDLAVTAVLEQLMVETAVMVVYLLEVEGVVQILKAALAAEVVVAETVWFVFILGN
jgi:hypothetical protein